MISKEINLELSPCKICGQKPASYGVRLQHKGCFIEAWCVECDHDDYDEPYPFVEHRLTIYGNTANEAEDRWNEIN